MPYGILAADQIQSSVTGVSLGAGNATRFKNRIINGDMVIDQRTAGASSTPTTDGTYTSIDRWGSGLSQSSKFSVQQNAGSVTPPVGFSSYLGVTSLAATSLGATDYFLQYQKIEGFNFADLGWGTANAKTITLSFWVRSSLTGTFGGSLSNSAQSRNYPFSYTINSANTWEYETITIPGDTTGTWIGATNGTGLLLRFSLGVGSTYSGTANAWTGSSFIFQPTSSVSVVGTNGATWYVTGVQVEVGSIATGFEEVDYTTQLAMCQRYFTKSYDMGSAVPTVNTSVGSAAYYSTNGNAFYNNPFKVTMRTTPTVTTYSYQGTSGKIGGASNAELTATVYQQGTAGFNVYAVGNGSAGDFYCNYGASAEL